MCKTQLVGHELDLKNQRNSEEKEQRKKERKKERKTG